MDAATTQEPSPTKATQVRAAVAEHGVRGYICKGSPLDLRRKVAQFLR